MIVDGKAIATDILAGIHERVRVSGRTVVVRALVVAPGPATESYLAIKEARAKEAGMHLEVIRMGKDATTKTLREEISIPGADSIIVQLPVPDTIDADAVLNALPSTLDADVLSASARREFSEGREGALLPPVVAAIAEILERSGIVVSGARAVVVGQGWLVGEPAATWLSRKGALVSVVTRESGDLSVLKDADIVISGAGVPRLIRPEHLKPGVVLIDAGTSESSGAIVGDADPACAHVASVFTPVPGGVGPIAVACLFKNVATLVERTGLQE